MAEGDDSPHDEGDTAKAPPRGEADRKKPRRRPRVSEGTPRECRELDPGDSCPNCGGDLRVVGEDESELLDMITAQLKVIHCPTVDCLHSTRERLLG